MSIAALQSSATWFTWYSGLTSDCSGHENGRRFWDVEIAPYQAGYSITSAPLALKNMVITGVAGGELGVRGFVDARDAATGKEIWRFNTIPEPGQPGSETWKPDALKTGGGPTWLTGTYDRDLNVIYWPVGNPSPNYNGDGRKGDNLYTDCVVALDADHGTLRWYFQFTPHDVYDWDATEILIAFDKTVAGKQSGSWGRQIATPFTMCSIAIRGIFAMRGQSRERPGPPGLTTKAGPSSIRM